MMVSSTAARCCPSGPAGCFTAYGRLRTGARSRCWLTGGSAATSARCGHPTTWTTPQKDGPNHLGLW